MATILVVDDKPLNRSVLTTLLGYRGHRLLEASNGLEAIEIALHENPQLIITDILMPRMDGYELVQKLRTLEPTKSTQIIFYSAMYLEQEAQALAHACGVSCVICKPAEPEYILKIVEEALARGQSKALPPETASATHAEVVRVLNDKLYHKVIEVEELNRSLESRVAARTLDLKNANRSLQQEILERQKAEEDASRSREDRLKMKGEFLSHVSHELRSPLAVVHQFTTILLDGLGGALKPDQKEYLEITLRNVNQLKYMIDDLLEASRADSDKLTVRRSSISLTDVVAQAVRSYAAAAKEKGIVVKSDSGGGPLPPVYADQVRICQVLTNLLDNAVKFSPPNSTVTVRTEILQDDPNFVCVSVADSGCGIDPENAERVFERLYQVKNALLASRQGLGLGLYICKELIALQGGGIWVDGKRKGGATFHFTLPIFTLNVLIAPIVMKDGVLASALVLLTIEVRPATAWPSERDRARVLNKSEQVLEKCMLQDLDVFLPMQSHAGSDFFLILAQTDQRGADVMLTRFRDQFSRCREFTAAGVRWSMESEPVDLSAMRGDWPSEKIVAHVAADLRERLRINTTRGAALYDQK